MDMDSSRSLARAPIDINDALRTHATMAADWDLAPRVQTLHEWAERFSTSFDLQIDTPAIAINPLERRVLGQYRYGRNGHGLRHEITLNSRHLDRPLGGILGTLLHEMLHQWQEVHGKPGRGNYHNRQFGTKAAGFGLIVDRRGVTRYENGRFTQLIEAHGITLDGLPWISPEFMSRIAPPENRNRKWTCGCTIVRSAGDLQALCRRCEQPFRRAM